MNQNVTVVYHSKESIDPSAFYVMSVDSKKLQEAFDEHKVIMIKCITIELERLTIKDAKTLFTERDIKDFLDFWKIKY